METTIDRDLSSIQDDPGYDTAWTPTPKQEEAITRTEFEVFFAGGRGSAKTDAGLMWLLYDIDNPKLRALVIRKNALDLSDWIDRAKWKYATMGVEVVGNPATIRFPSGAVIRTGHLKDENAFGKYQGQEYQRILIEELTQIPSEELYLKLLMSCRTSVPGLKAQLFATGNPGNIGHEWVYERFVESSTGKPYYNRDTGDVVVYYGDTYVDPTTKQTRVYIHATVYDNPYILREDPEYVHRLELLPPLLKSQWLYGSWNVTDIEGSYFGAEMRWLQEHGHIGSIHHDPLLPVHRSWDFGFNDETAIWFFQLYGKEIRLLAFWQDNGIAMRKWLSDAHDYGSAHEWEWGTDYFPHDFEVHEYFEGKTRKDKYIQFMMDKYDKQVRMGVDYKIVPKVRYIQDAIDQARETLPYCFFDAKNAKTGISALRKYRKEFNEKLQVYKNEPLHDGASHGASAFFQMAMGIKSSTAGQKREKSNAHRQSVRLPTRQHNMLTGEAV